MNKLVMTETNRLKGITQSRLPSVWRIWREWWPPATSNHRAQPHHHHPPLKLQNEDTTIQKYLPPNSTLHNSGFLSFLRLHFVLTSASNLKISLPLPMEESSRIWLSKSIYVFVILISSLHSALVIEGANSDSEISNGLCNSDLSSFLPFPYSNLPNMVCKPLWNSYLLRVNFLSYLLILFDILSLISFYKIAVFQVQR